MRSPEASAAIEAENDRIWGEGNWVQCEQCPKDAEGEFSYHHVNFHDDAHVDDAVDAMKYVRVRTLQNLYGWPERIAILMDQGLLDIWPPKPFAERESIRGLLDEPDG